MRTTWLILLALAGCSSLLDTPCAEGFEFRGGACVPANDSSVDGGGTIGVLEDAAATDSTPTPDAPVCTADLASDPQNCGVCGHVCASGICDNGHCLGELPAHIVIIGHDYRSHNTAMARVLGNAITLAAPHDLGVARVAGTAASQARAGTSSAIAQSLAAIGRPWHEVIPPTPGGQPSNVDVLLVDAQLGDGDAAQALGTAWKPTIDTLLANKGVVIVLEGAGGVGHRFAAGADLFVATQQDATGSPAFVTDANDALVQHVLSPYLADSTSVVFPGVVGQIATPSGAIAVHLTR